MLKIVFDFNVRNSIQNNVMSCHSLYMQHCIMFRMTSKTSWWKCRLIALHQTKQPQSQKQKLDKALRTNWNKQLWNKTERIKSRTKKKKKRQTFWRTGFPTCLLRWRKMRFENWNRVFKKLWTNEVEHTLLLFYFPFIHLQRRFAIAELQPMTIWEYDLPSRP
jgi:hypothetical protein